MASAPGALSISTSLALNAVGNARVFPLANTKRAALTLNGLTGSGATLAIDGSKDGGATWATTGMSATDYDLGTSTSSFTDDIDYRLLTRTYTHVQIRVATAGTGTALLLLVPLARGQDTYGVNAGGGGGSGGGANPAQDGTDATGVAAPAGAVGIRGWLSAIFSAERPIQGVIAMTPGTAITAQRGVRIKCSVAGNVSLTYADGSTDVIPVFVGVTETMGRITTINTSGTTATATYSALV